MKKLIIPVAVGLVVGLAGSTAAVALLGKEPETLEESLNEALGEEHGDSAAAHDAQGEPVDSAALAHGDSLSAEGAHAEAIPGEQAAADPLADPHAAEAAGAGHTPAATGIPAPPGGGLDGGRLAKLFATMPARDAAKVLERMDDNEVQVILGYLGNREAAAIMSNLTPERAAVISRAVIRGERSRP